MSSTGDLNGMKLPIGHANGQAGLEDDDTHTMFLSSDAGRPIKQENSGNSALDFDAASNMSLSSPVDQTYPPDGPAPTSYPNMLNASMQASYQPQVPTSVPSLEDRPSSEHTEQTSANDLLYRLVSEVHDMSARDKREYMNNLAMYDPQFSQPQVPPASRPPHWPNIDTRGIQRPPPSQQTSPSTAASEIPPQTPQDYRLLQGPKGNVTRVAPPEHYMPHGISHQHAPPPRQQAPAPPPTPSSQPRHQAPPPPPPQAQVVRSQPQHYVPYQLPPQIHWDHPDPASLSQLDMYSSIDYTPIEATPVPGMDQFGITGINAYGLAVDEDKLADTFGEVMPSQALY